MAINPGETPGLNFGPEEYFDNHRVAEEVIWPLVNLKVGRDFRSIKRPADVHIRVNDSHKDQEDIDVIFSAEKIFDGASSDTPFSIARLEIEPVVSGSAREMIIRQGSEADADVLFASDEDLVVKANTTYRFDSDGDFFIDSAQIVETTRGMLLWRSDQYAVDGEDGEEGLEATPEESLYIPTRLHEHDMEILESGLIILNAPRAITRALKAIKSQPITTY